MTQVLDDWEVCQGAVSIFWTQPIVSPWERYITPRLFQFQREVSLKIQETKNWPTLARFGSILYNTARAAVRTFKQDRGKWRCLQPFHDH